MPDTVRTLAALQTLLADNVAGDIGAQDVRDVLVSAWTPEHVRYLGHRLPDETAHADDDFFDDDVLAGTAVTPTGTATWVENSGRMAVTVDSQGVFPPDVAARVFALTPNASPVTIETRVTPSQIIDSPNVPGIYFGFADGNAAADSIAANYVYIDASKGWAWYHISGTFAAPSADTVFSNTVSAGGSLYIRAVWSAVNTFKYSFSLDGTAYSTFGVTTDTVALTPTHLFVGAGNILTTLKMPVAWDYVRVYDSDLSV